MTRPITSASLRNRVTAAIGMLVIILLFGCTAEEGDGGADAGGRGESPPAEPTLLEIDFARAAFQTVGSSDGCDDSKARLRWPSRAATDAPLSLRDADGLMTWPVNTFGRVRVDPATEICVEATLSNLYVSGFDQTEQCITIDSETDDLEFSVRLSFGGCVVDATAPIMVSRFDLPAFCAFACQGNDDCGRTLENCYEGCVDGLTVASFEADPVCHDATRDTIRCLYRAPCAGLPPERVCDGELADRAFDEPSCRPPAIPLPPAAPPPDPLRCDPGDGDLMSGNVGDFAIISRTQDDPNAYYLIVDLSQLSEIDAAIAEDPTSPSLELAATVARDLRLFDQTSSDECERTGTLSIRFAPPFTPNFGSIDARLAQLQTDLDALADLAGAVKQEATEAFFELVFCPATSEIVGDDLTGILIQGAVGCL